MTYYKYKFFLHREKQIKLDFLVREVGSPKKKGGGVRSLASGMRAVWIAWDNQDDRFSPPKKSGYGWGKGIGTHTG